MVISWLKHLVELGILVPFMTFSVQVNFVFSVAQELASPVELIMVSRVFFLTCKDWGGGGVRI